MRYGRNVHEMRICLLRQIGKVLDLVGVFKDKLQYGIYGFTITLQKVASKCCWIVWIDIYWTVLYFL